MKTLITHAIKGFHFSLERDQININSQMRKRISLRCFLVKLLDESFLYRRENICFG